MKATDSVLRRSGRSSDAFFNWSYSILELLQYCTDEQASPMRVTRARGGAVARFARVAPPAGGGFALRDFEVKI